MARTRCWCCYALMAEEHKGLFEAVTLILAARGFCGSGALKPLLAICWGHQKQVNQHLHQHRTGITHSETHSDTQNAFCLTYIYFHNSSEVHFSPKLSRSHSETKYTLMKALCFVVKLLKSWINAPGRNSTFIFSDSRNNTCRLL